MDVRNTGSSRMKLHVFYFVYSLLGLNFSLFPVLLIEKGASKRSAIRWITEQLWRLVWLHAVHHCCVLFTAAGYDPSHQHKPRDTVPSYVEYSPQALQ